MMSTMTIIGIVFITRLLHAEKGLLAGSGNLAKWSGVAGNIQEFA